MVLLGMVPVLIAVPPTTSSFSISATRLPNLAAWIAARCPAGPGPMTMRSYFSMTKRSRRRRLKIGEGRSCSGARPPGPVEKTGRCNAATKQGGKYITVKLEQGQARAPQATGVRFRDAHPGIGHYAVRLFRRPARKMFIK